MISNIFTDIGTAIIMVKRDKQRHRAWQHFLESPTSCQKCPRRKSSEPCSRMFSSSPPWLLHQPSSGSSGNAPSGHVTLCAVYWLRGQAHCWIKWYSEVVWKYFCVRFCACTVCLLCINKESTMADITPKSFFSISNDFKNCSGTCQKSWWAEHAATCH